MNLSDYEKELRMYMAQDDMTPERAVNHFITNLLVMKEQYPVAPNVNFHELGQSWNRLPSEERNRQKVATISLLQRATRRRE